METRQRYALKRCILLLASSLALSGCAVYAPPYAAYPAYDATPASSGYYSPYSYSPGYSTYGYSGYNYGYPSYVWPPVSLSLGYYGHSYHGGSRWSGYNRGWRGGGRGRR